MKNLVRITTLLLAAVSMTACVSRPAAPTYYKTGYDSPVALSSSNSYTSSRPTTVACGEPRMYQVEALVQDVQRAPEVCQEGRTRDRRGNGQTIFGTVLGGVIGNQFGGGSGRTAATIFGAGLGAVIAAPDRPKGTGKMRCERDGYIATVSYLDPETRQMITTSVPLERNTRADYIRIPVYANSSSCPTAYYSR